MALEGPRRRHQHGRCGPAFPGANAGQCPYRKFQQQQQQGAAAGGEQQPRTNPFQRTLSDFLPIVNDPEQLKNLGEYLRNFLDPFGIDVSYYVDTVTKKAEDAAKNTTTEASEEKKKDEAATAASSESSTTKMETEQETASAATTPKTTTTTTTTTNTSTSSAGPSTITVTPSSASSGAQPPKVDIVHQETTSTGVSPFAMATQALHRVLHERATAAAAAGASATPSDETKKTADSTSVESEFNMVDIEKELRIIKSIESLKQMGYTDESGWLTRLVVNKEGNINAVLDVLTPKSNANN